jgi:hypothetical protein
VTTPPDPFEKLVGMVKLEPGEGKVKLQSVRHLSVCLMFLGGVQVELTSFVTFLNLLQTPSVVKVGQEQDFPEQLKSGAGGALRPPINVE